MPFDNLKNAKIKKLNLALLALFTFLLLFSVFFIPLFGIAGLIFLPVPATILVMSGRVRDSIICVVIACVFWIFLDYLIAPVTALLILAISFIHRSSVRRKKSKLFTVSLIFLVFLGAVLLYLVLTSAINGFSYIGELINNYNDYIDEVLQPEFVEQYSSFFSIESIQLGPVLEQARDILKFIVYIIPGILISLFAFTGFMNYIATGAVLEKYGIRIKKFPPFKEWDMPWYWCWGAILGLVLVLVPYGSQTLNKIFDIAGFNLLAVFGLLYIILGISVLWGLMERFKISFIWRLVIFIALGLFLNFTIFIIPFIGLIDVWANFRRLERK